MINKQQWGVALVCSALIIAGSLIIGCEIDPKTPETKDLETVAIPVANPPASEVAHGSTVTLTTATAGAEIWYTTNNSDPAKNGAGSIKYTSPISITAAVTIKAIAVKDGMKNSDVMTASYTAAPPATVAMPTAHPPAGSEVESGTTVTLTTTTTDAEIWYTTNGSTPAKNGAGSTKYTTPIAITAAVTIKAIAVKDDMTDSNILTADYTIVEAGHVARPAADPPAGAVPSGTTITLSTTTANAEIWYTTDGSAPAKDGTSSTKYTTPISITVAVTIKAIAVKDDEIDSSILEASYTIMLPAATPTASPAAGEVESGTKVTLSTATADAEIWFTTNGSTPARNVAGSARYTTPIEIDAALTIKAIAVKDGMVDSGVLTAAYTVKLPEPEPVIIVGYYKVGDNTKACYWKDGVRHDLTGGGEAHAVIMHGSDIYISGQTEGSASYDPCYWKISNGVTTKINLTRPEVWGLGFQYGTASAIAVAADGTVYTAGHCRIDEHIYPYYWEGTAPRQLTANNTYFQLGFGMANAVAISGDTVYFAGRAQNGSVAVAGYWKKEKGENAAQMRTLTDPIADWDAEATTIVVQGGTVYLAGYYQVSIPSWSDIPCYWAEEEYQNYPNVHKTDLPGDGRVYDIAVGRTVYAAGPYRYWANGQKTDMDGTANAIAVLNGVAYLAGYTGEGIYYNPQAVYWKDGVRTNLPNGSNAVALAIAATNGAPVDDFVSVESITGVPENGFINEPLTLTGTVNPSNATNKTITWELKSAGTTGASLSGTTLTAPSMGTVTVTAKITNGRTMTADFIKDFEIAITRNEPKWRSEFCLPGTLGTDWYFGSSAEPAYPEKVGFRTTDDDYSIMQTGTQWWGASYLLISAEDKPAGQESSFVVEYVTNVDNVWDSDLGMWTTVFTLSGEQFIVKYTLATGNGSINITDFDDLATIWSIDPDDHPEWTVYMPEGVYTKQ